DDAPEPEPEAEATPEPAAPTEDTDLGGGSLFDLGTDDDGGSPVTPADEPPASTDPEPTPTASAPPAEIPESGSLVDLAAPEESRPSGADVSALATVAGSDEPDGSAEPEPEPEPAPEPEP